ncbi:MAG: Glycoside hydrolase 2 (Mannanase, beta-galactosidase) [Cirrosporium novae-zelandiae]|nr:MAG: Glycoside hydrolase 2 (Mannanase, beta-galactosidase) [Cirrosporium novae-zelandiae]
MDDQKHKAHHKKKKERKEPSGGQNPKAFAFAGPGRLQKQAGRSGDIKEKRFHVPLVDRLPEEAPPLVVTVVGPPGVGKTTLIKSLIKRYTKQTLSTPTGPLTVVTSKRRRLTFIECPSDSLASMIDVSKIADIILLMIDGNYGFEMETMEFLNILAASGMPGNVFGILTHLDLFKKQSTLRTAKKRLKHRFWSELYQGAKLFYLSGVLNGRYPDREVQNLSRFLSVMKTPRPLVWRNSHPYCLADRFLDITPPTAIEENPKCDRTVALYGYVRGTNFPTDGARVHIPGVGDLTVSGIESLPDPCPTPFMDQAAEKISGKTGRRRLDQKQKVLFAPMSDVGGVLVDRDAVYIDVKTSNFDKETENPEERGLGEQLVVGLQGERRLLGEVRDGVRLFKDGTAINSAEANNADTGRTKKKSVRFSETDGDNDILDGENESDGEVTGEDSDLEEFEGGDIPPERLGRSFKINADKDIQADNEIAFADSDSDLGSISSIEDQELEDGDLEEESDVEDEEDDDGALRWKGNLAENARLLHGASRRFRTADFGRLLYDNNTDPHELVLRWRGEFNEPEIGVLDSDDEDNFLKKAQTEKDDDDLEDRLIPNYDYSMLEERWSDEQNLDSLRQRFAISRIGHGTDDDGDDGEDASAFGDEDEGDGAFEDLETGEVVKPSGLPVEDNLLDLDAERERNAKRKEELKLRFEEEDREGFANDKANERRQGNAGEEEFGEDDWYDAQKAKLQKQLDINRAEFDNLDEQSRVRVEGYKAGQYVRFVLSNVPYEFSASFNPRFPILIGGLSPTEDRFGYVQVRIKRHRWHKKILKTNDPLIFSLGWRRFQTLPIYSTSDNRTRNRMLKYTPEHMHCFGTFWGPLIAPNSGFCCVQSFSNSNPGFRVAATGVVLNVDESVEIVKKLKLTGVPYKIFRNTAFIRDMFNTSLEIAKFEGANVRTVSGVRGQIKRALSKPEGHFRATFEDKILMSDIVFLRAWFPIKPHRFYNPVTNLLEAPDGSEEGWKGMRLTGEVRAAENIPIPQQKNSLYRQIDRPTRHFNPLRVPRQLAAELPFKSQIVQMQPQKKETYMHKRAVVLGGEERKARDLMQKIMTLRNDKEAKRRAKDDQRWQVHQKKVMASEEKKKEREKRERDEYWKREGKKRKGQEEGGGGKRSRR